MLYPRLTALLATLLLLPALARAEPMPITDLAKQVDVQIYRLTLSGAMTTTGKDGAVNPHNLVVTLKRQDGVFNPNAAAAAPSFNRAGHRGTVDDVKAKLDKIALSMELGSDRWVKGDPDASYTLSLKPDGNSVAGTFTGTFQGNTVEGEIAGVIIRPGWYGSETTDAGQVFSLNMGKTRGNWNRAKWGGFNFFTPIDISAFDGFSVTITTDQPRHDAWVDLGVMEEDGSWYLVRDAIPLSRKEQTVFVHLDDLRHAEWVFNDTGTGGGADGNFDEDFHFDRTKLFRLALGVINAHGVGEVNFTVTDISVAPRQGPPPHEQPVEAEVTGRTLSVHGQAEIPGGMFGFHTAGGSNDQADGLRVGSLRPIRAMGWGGAFVSPPDPERGVFMTVAGNYDRKQQLPQYDNPTGWQEKAKSIGQNLGNQAKPYAGRDDVVIAVEWWNEPYLELGKFLENGMAKKVKPDADTKAGDPVVFGGKELESMVWAERDGKLVPTDPSRFTYWSGKQIAVWYAETFNAVAPTAKEISPHLQMVGGTGFRWSEDDWASWHILHKPIVDRCIEYLDGFCEHHYQGHTDAMPATYEVLNAYTIAKYNKKLPVYNTETNDLWDAPARGNAAATHQFGGTFKPRRRMIYNLRGILTAIHQTPDKAKARAIHALWGGAKDNRRKAGEWVGVERDIQVRIDQITFAHSFEYADGKPDEKKTANAGDGQTLAIIDYTVKNTGKKDGSGFFPAQARLSVEAEPGVMIKAKPVGFDANKNHKKNGPYAAPGKGAEGKMRMAFAISTQAKDRLIQLVPKENAKNKTRIHLKGEFAPFTPSEWSRRGIDKGEYYALKFMRDLRGQLIETESADRDIWVLSSVDPKTMSHVTIVYNDSPFERTINLTLNPPNGVNWSDPKAAMLVHDDTGHVGITELDTKVEVGHIPNQITLKPAHAWRAAVKLDKLPAAEPEAVREQVFASMPDNGVDPILFELAPGQVQPLVFDLGDQAKGNARAWVRVVLENTSRADGTFTLGGQSFKLPHAHTPANGPYIREVEVDPSLLAAKTNITFAASEAEEGGNGFRLCAASIVVERE